MHISGRKYLELPLRKLGQYFDPVLLPPRLEYLSPLTDRNNETEARIVQVVEWRYPTSRNANTREHASATAYIGEIERKRTAQDSR